MKRTATTVVSVVCLLLGAVAASASVEVVDFDRLPMGTVVSEVFGSQGTGPILIDAYNERFGEGTNAAVIFDTASPTGDDVDLGAPNETFGTKDKPMPGRGRGGVKGSPFENAEPLGKLLIVAESMRDADGDGLVDDPDDEGQFRVLRFTLDFSKVAPVTLHRMTLIDVEDQERTPAVRLLDESGGVLSLIELPITGDNGVVRVDLGPTDGVHKMVVELHGSGAISSMRFEKEGPKVDIETLTNGIQADLVTDKDIPWLVIGNAVNWTYEVTNTGTEPLRDIVVTDDRGVEISCPAATLEPGDKTICTSSGLSLNLELPDLGFSPVRGLCQSRSNQLLYGNVGSVAAMGTGSAVAVSDSDPSHYCSGPPAPSIYVRKQAKGPDSRAIASGSDATFKIVVWNNGTMDLTNITVTDVLSPDCDRTFSRLGAGKSTTYTCSAPALAIGGENISDCSFVNEVTVTGEGGGKTVSDSDTSTVELIGVAIDKSFQSATSGAAHFEITVTNNGCDLEDVRVADPLAPDCEREIGDLPAGGSHNYTCSMPLENEACVEGKSGDSEVSACDTATFVVEGGGAAGGADGGAGGEGGGEGGGDAGDGATPDGDGEAADGGKGASSGMLLLLLALLVGGGLFAWNRMKAG